LLDVEPQHFSLCVLDLKEALHTSTLGMGAPVDLCELAQVKHGMLPKFPPNTGKEGHTIKQLQIYVHHF
jgi:hypothetical protein